jgi:hypothetical protein
MMKRNSCTDQAKTKRTFGKFNLELNVTVFKVGVGDIG